MKKIINIMSRAVQVVLAAPVQLPAKVVQVAKYIAVGLGILQTVIPDREEDTAPERKEDSEAAE